MPGDLSDSVLGWLKIEKVIHRLEVPERTLSQENGNQLS
jgi:hypothetical protein